MDIITETTGNATIVALQGQVNSANAQALEVQLVALVDAGARQLVLDCAGLDYISSAGLRLVLVLAKRLKLEGGRLVLCAMRSHVHEVFDISGFLAILDVQPTREGALARLL
ncbi:STAS domain-containing protein [Comamonas badia]|uniref:STAS domain-containing protein n=1 Tax=Comamonas badia TaxID=265291 RepID=UPI00040F876B|nr:STAS domain-containing protein [Comamonas badia]